MWQMWTEIAEGSCVRREFKIKHCFGVETGSIGVVAADTSKAKLLLSSRTPQARVCF
jgi:hypothetical protein